MKFKLYSGFCPEETGLELGQRPESRYPSLVLTYFSGWRARPIWIPDTRHWQCRACNPCPDALEPSTRTRSIYHLPAPKKGHLSLLSSGQRNRNGRRPVGVRRRRAFAEERQPKSPIAGLAPYPVSEEEKSQIIIKIISTYKNNNTAPCQFVYLHS